MKAQSPLIHILEGTSPETGEDFFAALVKSLSQSLNMAAAWVTEYAADFQNLRTLAFWFDGRWIEGMDGTVRGTPCEVVLKNGEVLFIADEVAGEFPDDPDLVKLGMTSYIGIPFKDNSRQVFGHLAVMNRRPVHDKEAALSLMRIFAPRAGGANLAAHLSEASRLHLAEVIGGLDPPGRAASPVWVPEILTAVSTDGTTFPAEATLSRADAGAASSYILILRNINDRLASGHGRPLLRRHPFPHLWRPCLRHRSREENPLRLQGVF